MKKLVLGAVVAFASAGLLLAQQQPRPSLDPNAIPVDQEPHHKLVFANAFVRAIDVRLPPEYVSLKHTHASDNVTVTIAPGRADAESVARIGRAGFARGGYSHTVTNSGSMEQRFVNVEILTTGSTAMDARELPLHTLELENDKVRVYRLTLGPGQSIAGHSHGHGWLSVTVRGGTGAGSLRWHDALSVDAMTNGADGPIEIVELEPK